MDAMPSRQTVIHRTSSRGALATITTESGCVTKIRTWLNPEGIPCIQINGESRELPGPRQAELAFDGFAVGEAKAVGCIRFTLDPETRLVFAGQKRHRR